MANKQQASKSAAQKVNPLIANMAYMMYTAEVGQEVPFDSAAKEVQSQWHNRAAAACVALDKMNKKIIAKDEQVKAAGSGLNVDQLTNLIKDFCKKITTIKCPRCKGNTDIRAELFPCRELALTIEGQKNG